MGLLKRYWICFFVDGVFSPLNNADFRPQYSDGSAGLSYGFNNNSDNAFASAYTTHSATDSRPHYSEGGVNARPLYNEGSVDSRPLYSEGDIDRRFQYSDGDGGGTRLSSEYNRSENAYTSNYTSVCIYFLLVIFLYVCQNRVNSLISV